MWGIIFVCFFPTLNFTFRNLILFGFHSRKAGRFKLPKPCRFPCIVFTLFLPQQPNAKGIRLWQHCLRFKSYIGELLSKFLLWTKCQIILQFCWTDRGHGHGRLAEVKIWNAVSSLALLIREQFKAQLLLISIKRKIVRIQQAEFLSDEQRPTLKTLDFTIRIGITSTFLYFNLYLNTAFAADYVYFTMWGVEFGIG